MQCYSKLCARNLEKLDTRTRLRVPPNRYEGDYIAYFFFIELARVERCVGAGALGPACLEAGTELAESPRPPRNKLRKRHLFPDPEGGSCRHPPQPNHYPCRVSSLT